MIGINDVSASDQQQAAIAEDWAWTCEDTTSPAAAAGGAGTEGPAAAANGGTFSVTRPANNSEVEAEVPRLLLAGLDTLDFGVFVEFDARWPKIMAKLAKLKRAARTTGSTVIAGGRCAVLAGGKPNYPYLVQFPGFQLYLSRKELPEGQTPNVYVSLNSQTLWHLGEREAVALALTELEALAPGQVQECRMSRCDLAADLLIPGGLSFEFVKAHAVGQSQRFQSYIDGDKLETLYNGSSSAPVQLRLYDKSLEISLKDKAWFLPLWGLASNGNVWRFEFQLRREFLKSCGIDSLDDLLARRAAVWSYLTGVWFSLRLQDNENATRRRLHPLWEVVQSASERLGSQSEPVTRARRSPSLETVHIEQQAKRNLIGFAARRKCTDFATAARELIDSLRKQMTDGEFETACQRKAIQVGIDLREDAA